MSSSYSISASRSFTITHAREIASKVRTDLKRFQRLYGSPTDAEINDYEAELITLLKEDVIDKVIYGFKRYDRWTAACVRYKALPGGTLALDDDPGKIRPGLDTVGASFTSSLTYNSKWYNMPPAEQAQMKATLPFQRVTREEPTLESGYWTDDLNYVAGDRGLGRSTVAGN